ncbi:hypothetical protein [Streptomyces kronopolitis]|uniref:hypothetical protein n=1 Tax=Streptomyces kronopolitis TaxID=1612435 RepID=UPI003D96C94C
MHLRVQGTPRTDVDGAISPLGGPGERRLLTCLPLNADRVLATRTLLGVRRPDEAPRTAGKAIGHVVRYPRLDLRPGAALADRRAVIRTGREGALRRVGGWTRKSASMSDRRSATSGGQRAHCRKPSPRARWVSG